MVSDLSVLQIVLRETGKRQINTSLEAVNGNRVTIGEGGSPYYASRSNGYCVIREQSKNELESNTFLGYIYLPVDIIPHNPMGDLNSVTGGAGSVTVRGWALD